MARHARAEIPALAAPEAPIGADPAVARIAPARHRRVRSAHRRAPHPGRTALALCGTALAAAMGGVFSGVLPPPPGVPRSLVVAGDPAGPQPVAVRGTGHARPSGSPSRGRAGGGVPGHGGRPRPAPTGTASTTASSGPDASPSATSTSASPTASASASGTTASASASASASPDAAAQADADVLALVNQQRAANGCGALTASPPLGALASAFSQEMAAKGFFGHTDPSGKTPWDRAAAAGITDLGGENIARGQQTAADVMAAWMNSPGHRANILNCAYHVLGVGVYFGPGGPWWTQDFGY